MHRLYLVPTLLINFVIILIPALLTIALAFFRWDGISTPTFVGLGNFVALCDDGVFWTALTNNIIWTAIFLVVPIAHGPACRDHAAGRAARQQLLPGRSISCRSSSPPPSPRASGKA